LPRVEVRCRLNASETAARVRRQATFLMESSSR
jgi:hypothetical protein